MDIQQKEEVVWLSIEESHTGSSQFQKHGLLAIGFLVGIGVYAAIGMKIKSRIDEMNRPVKVTQNVGPNTVYPESFRLFSEYIADPASVEIDPEIQQAVDKISGFVQNNDDESFREFVDKRRYSQLLDQAGAYSGMSPVDKNSERARATSSITLEAFLLNPTIVGVVTPNDDLDTRIVYFFSKDPDNDISTECNLVLGRDGNQWRPYNWMRLDLGLSDVDQTKNWIQDTSGSAYLVYVRWIRAINAADEAIENGASSEEIKKKLLSAEALVPTGNTHDYCLLLTGYRWVQEGYQSDAQRCYERMYERDNHPGAHFSLAICKRYRSPAEALVHAKDFYERVGPSPDICELRAELLEQLGRHTEASRYWKELLRYKPSDTAALGSLLSNLPIDRKSDIFSLLERAPDPIEVASELIDSVADSDFDGATALVSFLANKAPDTPATHSARGKLLSSEGRFQEAASEFKIAMDSDGDPSKHVWDYIVASVKAGQVLEAIDKTPSLDEAYDELWYGYEEAYYSLSKDEYRTLLEKRMAGAPDDLEAIYRWIELYESTGSLSEVESLMRETLKSKPIASDDDGSNFYRNSIASNLATLLYSQDNWQEVYPALDTSEEVFEDLILLAIKDERTEVVQELLDRGKKQGVSEAILSYVQGEMAMQEDDPAEAVKHFRASLDLDSETSYSWKYRNRLLQASIEAKQWEDLYLSSDDRSDIFETLMYRFESENDWESLAHLCRLHSKAPDSENAVSLALADASWEMKDYRKYLQRTDKLIKKQHELSSYTFDEIVERRVSAYLREDRYGEALHLAKKQESHLLTAAIYAIRGDTTRATQSALRAAEASDSLDSLYRHDDAGRIFLGKAYTELHREYPIHIPYNGVDPVALLYCSEEPNKFVDKMIEAIRKLPFPGEITITPLRKKGTAYEYGAAFRLQNATIWIAVGKREPFDEFRLNEKENPLAEVINKPNYWLLIGTAGWTETERDKLDPLARLLARYLFEGRQGAVRLSNKRGYILNRAYPNSDELLAKWISDKDLDPFESSSHELTYFDEGSDVENDRRFRDSLFKAYREYREGTNKKMMILVQPSRELKCGSVWIQVDTIELDYGSLKFTGTLTEPSSIYIDLREGMTMTANQYEIVGWRWEN